MLRSGGGAVVVGREPRLRRPVQPAPTRCSASQATSRVRRSARCGWRSPTRRTSPTSPPPTAGSGGPSGCWRRSSPGRCTAGCGSPAPTGWPTSTPPRTLTSRAVDVARSAGDVDLELVALSQLGLIRVGKGDTAAGFALIDEAMAAALAGERSSLDTVVYTCCDMLNACELASDIERAAQWCKVADDFVEHLWLPVPVRRVPHLLRQRADRQGTVGRRRAGAGRRSAHHRRRLPRPARQGADPPRRRCGSAKVGWRRPSSCWPVSARASRPKPRRRCRWRRCCWPAATRRPPAATSSSGCITSRSTARISRPPSTCSSTPISPRATSTPATAAARRLAEVASSVRQRPAGGDGGGRPGSGGDGPR